MTAPNDDNWISPEELEQSASDIEATVESYPELETLTPDEQEIVVGILVLMRTTAYTFRQVAKQLRGLQKQCARLSN